MIFKRIGAFFIVACMLFAGMTMMAVPVSAGKQVPQEPITLSSDNARSDGYFGWSVATDGSYIVVGAYDETSGGIDFAGNVYVYYASNGTLVATLTSPNSKYDGYFGYSVAIGGGHIVIGAPYEDVGTKMAGHAYIYELSDLSAAPHTLASPDPQDSFAFGKAVATDGATVVVGEPYKNIISYGARDGAAHVFNSDATLMGTVLSSNPTYEGYFGWAVAVSGKTIVVGAPWETNLTQSLLVVGFAYVFSTSDLSATPVRLTSGNPTQNGWFGGTVAVEGRTVVVGAKGETSSGMENAGNVYIFTTSGRLTKSLASPNPEVSGGFGISVGIGGRSIVVGAYGETANSLEGAGHAYVFTSRGILAQALISLNAEAGGSFGNSVAISNGKIAVGAPYETSEPFAAAGHAYIFR